MPRQGLALLCLDDTPFGGFFASGIKRAYNLDDFASIIPGHGGVYDRVDCQLIMGLAMHVYHRTFIGTGATSPPSPPDLP